MPIGTEIEYSFERFDDQLVRRPDGHLPEPMPILMGTVTADDVTQIRFIVYDYSLGEQPLPDTAVEPATSQFAKRLAAQPSSLSSKSGQAAMSTPWFSGDASVHQWGTCVPSARRPPASSAAATLASA